MDDLLNEPQARALKSTFARLEELLEQSRRLRSDLSGVPDGVFLRHAGNLTEQQSALLEEQENRARTLLGRLHDELTLESEMVNSEHRLVSQCALMGADLQEFLPDHWHGNGELEPQATAILDAAIPQLIDVMQQMVDVLE